MFVLFCMCAKYTLAQTELLITYLDQTDENFSISEQGKLSFSKTDLIVYDGEQSPITIPISSIRKINVSSKSDNVSITENVITEQSNIVLYPNPAGDYICIKSSGSEKIAVSIYSITGQIMLQGKFYSGEQINISRFSPGLYIVKTDKKTIKFSKL